MVNFIADNIISSLGFSSEENFEALKRGDIGIKPVNDQSYYPEPFPASVIDTTELKNLFSGIESGSNFTRLEKMMILSLKSALQKSNIDITSKRTGIILSTTKGNIDLLEPGKKDFFEPKRVMLWRLGEVIGNYFGNPNQILVMSNACVSGVLALNTAAMLISSGQFDHIVVTGGDIVSRFVVSGFMSFHSLSPVACKPFDEKRDGLSLGEAAGTIILGKDRLEQDNITFLGSGSANDANHISGPSRTGEGSFIAIKRALSEAGIGINEIDHISAHGTATPYNDEMESISISRHNLEKKPVNSFKGNWGHTLGAAGIIEAAALLHEMRTNTLVKSAGFEQLGVSKNINVIADTYQKELSVCLKMASGFGGSNAALIIKKD